MRFSTRYGRFSISNAPGHPQMANCYGFFVPAKLRGQGMENALLAQQEKYLVGIGFDYAVCTVRSDNTAQRQVLQTAGWRMLASFNDSKSGNSVELWGWTVKRREEDLP